MKFYVFSPSLETLGIISNYSAMTHVRQFAGSGSFKLTAPFTSTLFDLLVDDNILYWEDRGKIFAVYIDSVICEAGKDGMYITASGKNLRAYLTRRIVWNNINFNGTAEDFGRRVVSEAAITSIAARRIPLLSLGTRKGIPVLITRKTENENIENLINTITASTGVGFDVTLDRISRRLLFDAYEPADRRTTQTTTPWVIVSRDRNNVVTETYTRSGLSHRNTALISGYTDESTGARYEVEITAGSGLSRKEVFVSGSTSPPRPNADIGETPAQALTRYRNELLQRGNEQLAAQVMVESLEVEPDGPLLDQLNVGDKVTAMEKQFNLMMQTYVSEITTYYGSTGRRIDITLGDAVPTIYQKIKKELE